MSTFAVLLHTQFMELDLKIIEDLSRKKEQENIRFCAELYKMDPNDTDHLAKTLGSEISSKIDCRKCANCCAVSTPCLSTFDLNRLSEGIGIAVDSLEEKYIELDQHGDKIFKTSPCPFLKNKSCSVYDHRPSDCRSYPHFHQKDFSTRMWNYLEMYGICPIVFNFFEQLKKELDFS